MEQKGVILIPLDLIQPNTGKGFKQHGSSSFQGYIYPPLEGVYISTPRNVPSSLFSYIYSGTERFKINRAFWGMNNNPTAWLKKRMINRPSSKTRDG